MRISNSFSEGEIQVMEFILQTLLRGGSPVMAVRNKDFASLYRKVTVMKKRVIEKQAETERKAAAKSAVGTIKAESADDALDVDELDEELEQVG